MPESRVPNIKCWQCTALKHNQDMYIRDSKLLPGAHYNKIIHDSIVYRDAYHIFEFKIVIKD